MAAEDLGEYMALKKLRNANKEFSRNYKHTHPLSIIIHQITMGSQLENLEILRRLFPR